MIFQNKKEKRRNTANFGVKWPICGATCRQVAPNHARFGIMSNNFCEMLSE